MVQSVSNCKQVSPAVTYSESGNRIRRAPPRLGEHTDEVLRELLGYSEGELSALREEKVIK
jgi:succinate--hydroxymethylglutarate CoA-transferase